MSFLEMFMRMALVLLADLVRPCVAAAASFLASCQAPFTLIFSIVSQSFIKNLKGHHKELGQCSSIFACRFFIYSMSSMGLLCTHRC